MGVIFNREIKALLRNIKALICISLFLMAEGIFLLTNSILTGYSGIQSVFSNMSLVAALAIPPVAAASISAERKSGTEKFLLALPVTKAQIVVGKFFATLAFFMIPTAVMALFPIILALLGAFGMAQGYVILLVFVFFEAFLIALSIMLSAFFKKTWLATLISYVVNVVLFVLGMISVLFGGVVENILKWISPFRRFDPIVFDFFDLTSILFYLSFGALFLFIAVMVLSRRKAVYGEKIIERNQRKNKRIVLLSSVIALTILTLNVGASLLPSSASQLDVSVNKLYSVSDSTKKYLDNLDEEITVYLLNPSSSEEKLHSFIKRYCSLSDKITLKEIDTTKDTDFLSRYGLSTTPSFYSMIIESDKRYKLVDSEECFSYYYNGNSEYIERGYMSPSEYISCGSYYTQMYEYYKENGATAAQLSSVYEIIQSLASESIYCFNAEEPMTTAIEYVTANKVPRVYLISNHNEKGSSSNPLDISVSDIPDDASCLVINNPDVDYSEDEISKLIRYSDRGGRLLIVTDKELSDKPNLKRFISAFGLEAGEVISVEESTDVSAIVNTGNEVFVGVGISSISISDANAITYSEIDGLEFYPLLTVSVPVKSENESTEEGESSNAETEAEEKIAAVSVTRNGSPKLIWFTGGDSFEQDSSKMSDEEITNYYYLLSLRNLSLEWIKLDFSSAMSFGAAKQYTASLISVQEGAKMWVGIIFIGLCPLCLLGGALLNRYTRKKRSENFNKTM